MADEKPTFKTVDWKSVCDKANGPKEKEVSYEFSNGRKFKEPFYPDGVGIYEPPA